MPQDLQESDSSAPAESKLVLPPGTISLNPWNVFALVPWKQRAVVGIGFLFASLFELVGLAIVVPLFAMISSTAARGGLKGAVRDALAQVFGSVGLEFNFLNLLFAVLLLLSVKALVTISIMRYVGELMAHLVTETRMRLIRGYLDARWTYLSRKRIPQIVQSVGIGANVVGVAFHALSGFFATCAQSAVYLAIVVLISPGMAVIAALVAVFMALSYSRLVRRTRMDAKRQNRELRRLSSVFADALVGMKAIKAMGRQARFATLFARDSVSLQRLTRSRVVSSEFADELQEPLIAIGLGVGLYVGNVVMELDLGHQFIIVMVLIRLIGSFKQLQRTFHRMSRIKKRYSATMSQINRIERLKEEPGGPIPPDMSRGLELRDISFSFTKNQQLLTRFSLTVRPGELTLLSGTSGAGKSTILDIILGLLRPRGGTVTLGGVRREDANILLWRRQIGYVPQDPFLFHDSIYANITLGEPGYSATDVRRALSIASAEKFVDALPQNLNEDVGERGMKLSGGQKQRIALARALLHRPKFLILDEATSALDPDTETQICEQIKALVKTTGLTALVVSHSEKWKLVADSIVAIEQTPPLTLIDTAGEDQIQSQSRQNRS